MKPYGKIKDFLKAYGDKILNKPIEYVVIDYCTYCEMNKLQPYCIETFRKEMKENGHAIVLKKSNDKTRKILVKNWR